VPFGFYNVGRGIKTSIRELAELLLKITGSTLPIRYEPAGQTFVTNRVGDAVAAERDLGFTWTVDLEEGFRQLIEWRKNHMEQVEERRKRAGADPVCGIAGIVNMKGEPASPVLLKRMTDALAHRGPDGEGIYVDGAVGLAIAAWPSST
jgi:hypothetical protein